jgi:hypothetical protein
MEGHFVCLTGSFMRTSLDNLAGACSHARAEYDTYEHVFNYMVKK